MTVINLINPSRITTLVNHANLDTVTSEDDQINIIAEHFAKLFATDKYPGNIIP